MNRSKENSIRSAYIPEKNENVVIVFKYYNFISALSWYKNERKHSIKEKIKNAAVLGRNTIDRLENGSASNSTTNTILNYIYLDEQKLEEKERKFFSMALVFSCVNVKELRINSYDYAHLPKGKEELFKKQIGEKFYYFDRDNLLNIDNAMLNSILNLISRNFEEEKE